jgi:hypothetical protein
MHGQSRFFTEKFVKATQQGSTSGQNDATVDKVCS